MLLPAPIIIAILGTHLRRYAAQQYLAASLKCALSEFARTLPRSTPLGIYARATQSTFLTSRMKHSWPGTIRRGSLAGRTRDCTPGAKCARGAGGAGGMKRGLPTPVHGSIYSTRHVPANCQKELSHDRDWIPENHQTPPLKCWQTTDPARWSRAAAQSPGVKRSNLRRGLGRAGTGCLPTGAGAQSMSPAL
eukprot:2164862-Rhodomonas_salina.1